MSDSNKPKITINATIHQPVAKVWSCWNEPEHIVNWNFASDDWCCPSARIDLRPGGRMESRMEARDGSMGFDFGGTYQMVIPHEQIIYKLDDDRMVTNSFQADDKSTRITVIFEAESENPLEMQRAGWQAILDNFKKYTESLT